MVDAMVVQQELQIIAREYVGLAQRLAKVDDVRSSDFQQSTGGFKTIESDSQYAQWKADSENKPILTALRGGVIGENNTAAEIERLKEQIDRLYKERIKGKVSELFAEEIARRQSDLAQLNQGQISLKEAKALQKKPVQLTQAGLVDHNQLAELLRLDNEIKAKIATRTLEVILSERQELWRQLESRASRDSIPSKPEPVDWDSFDSGDENEGLKSAIQGLDQQINKEIDRLQERKQRREQEREKELQELHQAKSDSEAFLEKLDKINPVDLSSIMKERPNLFRLRDDYQNETKGRGKIREEIRKLDDSIQRKISELREQAGEILKTQPSILELQTQEKWLKEHLELLNERQQFSSREPLPVRPESMNLVGLQGTEQLRLKQEIEGLERAIDKQLEDLVQIQASMEQAEKELAIKQQIPILEGFIQDQQRFLETLEVDGDLKQKIASRPTPPVFDDGDLTEQGRTLQQEATRLEKEIDLKINELNEQEARVQALEASYEERFTFLQKLGEGPLQEKIATRAEQPTFEANESPRVQAVKEKIEHVELMIDSKIIELKQDRFINGLKNSVSNIPPNMGVEGFSASTELAQLKVELDQVKNEYNLRVGVAETQASIAEKGKALARFEDACVTAFRACIEKIDDKAQAALSQEDAAAVQAQTRSIWEQLQAFFARMLGGSSPAVEKQAVSVEEQAKTETSSHFKRKFEEAIGKERDDAETQKKQRGNEGTSDTDVRPL